MTYVRKTPEELRQLAQQAVRGELFFSWQVPPHDAHLLSMIFMPLAFMDAATKQQLVEEEVTAMYAPMAQAGPRGINGYPIFFTVSLLSREDDELLRAKVRQMQLAMEAVE